MGLKYVSFIFLSALWTVQAMSEHKPMVAFVCDKTWPAMYLTSNGWTKDDSTECQKTPEDVFNYCKKVYPTLDVRNVVEASSEVTIEKWCGFGHNKCHHEFTVRPWRCLVGAFQSDALLVPEHCLFDHIHETKECKRFDQWRTTSSQSCVDRGMEHNSLAILQPCGIARFQGVEFVCCPQGSPPAADDVDEFLHNELKGLTTKAPTTTTEDDERADIDVGDDDSEEDVDDDVDDREDINEDEDESDEDFEQPVTPFNIYNKYLHKSKSEFSNEHDYFMKAKNDLQKRHHEKVTKMMKEWAEARQRVQDLKSFDPKGAEKLNKEITARFQKTYEALEQEGLAEKQQLVGLHQQRVQAELNEKKRHAMEHYMEVLTDNNADAAVVLKALEHYIKTEQKDRLHTLNHFKHVRDMDPTQAEAIREQNLDHLDLIDARIQQAVDMLNRLPKFEKKVRSQIEDYLRTFRPLDSSVDELLKKPVVIKEKKPVVPPQPKPQQGEVAPDVDEKIEVEVIHKGIVPKKSPPSTPAPPMPTDAPSTPKMTHVKLQKDGFKVDAFDDEIMENEHDYVELHEPKPHVAHMKDSSMDVHSYIQQEPLADTSSVSGATLAIAIGSITVFAVIVVGIIVLRKRAQRVGSNQGVVEVTHPGASPEERHVQSMQINGYENPTYRYFEMSGTTNA